MQVQSKILFPEITINRIPPLNLKQGDEIYFQHEYEKKIPAVYLHELSNVNVSQEGIVFRKFDVFEKCLIDKSRKIHYGYKYFLSNYLKRKKITLSKNEKYILAFDEWSNGYFHWMCDVLPRLMSIKSILPECILLLPEIYTESFILESLKMIGCNNIKMIPKNSYVKAPNLIVPEHIAPTGNYNPDVMEQLQNALLWINADHSQKNSGINIYVSRKKALYKFILNEEEVFKTLEAYQFNIVFLEDYSLHEKIPIIKNSSVMIGMHGANFTNMLFMKKNSFILEFRKKGDANNNAFFSLASGLGINYLYQFCDYTISNYTHPNKFDIRVDTDELKKNLDIICETKKIAIKL